MLKVQGQCLEGLEICGPSSTATMQQSNLEIDNQGPGLIQLGKPWQGIASLQIQCVQDVKTRKCAFWQEGQQKLNASNKLPSGMTLEAGQQGDTRNVKLSALAPSQNDPKWLAGYGYLQNLVDSVSPMASYMTLLLSDLSVSLSFSPHRTCLYRTCFVFVRISSPWRP